MKAWDAFLSDLEQTLGKGAVEHWLRPLVVIDFDACNLYLEAQNSFQITWFEEHIRKRAKETFLNNNAHPIKIHFSSQKKVRNEKAKSEAPAADLELTADGLDPSMTFSTFVSDQQNNLTLKFLKEITPGTYNPIFLYGPPGTGKTHLLMACAQHLRNENLSVFYVHAETFTEHVVKAIRNSQMRKFREIYRNHDVLIIDDIHFLARRAATQEELFHTFNALHTSGKQIIFSSHLLPSRIVDIEPRLISRFEWGIVLQLHILSQEKMEEVIHNRATAYDFPLSDTLIKFLIEKFHASPKSMMRALEALILRHRSPTTLSIQTAEHLLTDLLEVEKKTKITPDKILSATAGYFGIRAKDILGKSQSKECSFPRKLAMFLCRKRLGLSYLAIGRVFSRDHSTVMSSIKFIEQKSSSELEVESALEQIGAILKK